MPHRVTILETEMLNHNVKRFVTTKPDGYAFEPGQATDITLCREGYRAEERPFTFASRPADPNLEFVIKLYYDRDGVTDEMSSVEEGEEFEIGDPRGAISYEGPGVFVAGGAGITPFLSIFRELDANDEMEDQTLWFANSHPRDIFLEDELKSYFPKDNLRLLVTDAPEDGAYEEGTVDEAFLKENEEALQDSFVYVCGPPQMTQEIVGMVKDLGVDDSMIVHEDWS